MTQDGWALQNASEPLRADKEIVLAAVKQSGRVLEYASEPLRADKEIVLAAVKQNWRALEYASEPLRADKEIVLAPVKENNDLLSDPEWVKAWRKLPVTKRTVQAAIDDAVLDGEYARGIVKTWQSDAALVVGLVSALYKKTKARVAKLEAQLRSVTCTRFLSEKC